MGGAFRSIHANWRVVRYDAGDTFPAHQDQMDSMQCMDPTTGRKDLVVSTHTLLVQLSPNPPENQGGATRFYPRTKVAGKSPGQYDYAVDIRLPQGWALFSLSSGWSMLVNQFWQKMVVRASTLPRLVSCEPYHQESCSNPVSFDWALVYENWLFPKVFPRKYSKKWIYEQRL